MKEKRLDYELMRILAIFLVVFNHTDNRGFFLYQVPGCSAVNAALSLLLATICKTGVPLFFMVSGGLLLHRQESLKKLFCKRIVRMALVLVLFSSVLYGFWIHWGFVPNPGVKDFVRRILTEGISIPYWYLYTYLGVLFLLPLLRPMAQNLSDQGYMWLFCVHFGFFGVIAHGCNSVSATDTALKLSDYVVTEAGFGADLGAEKFLDIKCRYAGMEPDAVVIVATVKALKYNGGVPKTELGQENLTALEKGIPNLLKHVENITQVFGLPAVVAINRFTQDTDAELNLIREKCAQYGVNVALSEVWGKGSEGGLELAEEVLRLCEKPHDFHFSYELDKPIGEKIETIVRKIYGGSGVNYSKAARDSIQKLTELGYGELPICMAKTQYSLSDDQTKLGRPEGFTVNVTKVKISAGAGFIVVQTGDIMTMPGLPKVPAAEKIDVDENGVITGLF